MNDYHEVILSALGTALVAIAGWMAPAIKRSIESLPAMFEAQRDIAATQREMTASLSVLANVCAAMMSQTPHDRSVLLLVEDCTMDARMFQAVAWDIIRESQSTFVLSPTLGGAYRHLPFARVIVIDVGLPDANESTVKRFVAEMGGLIPIIVWAANDYKKEDFIGCYDVKNKQTNIDEVMAVVRKALAEPRRV